MQAKTGQKLYLLHTISLLVMAIVIVLAIGYGWYKVSYPFELSTSYQAVFLDNGQVYFGKIDRQGHRYVELTNIFYFQIVEPLQGTEANNELTTEDLSLVKLGSEVHAPEDRMHINREHIIFIENLRESSKVVQAIRGYTGR